MSWAHSYDRRQKRLIKMLWGGNSLKLVTWKIEKEMEE